MTSLFLHRILIWLIYGIDFMFIYINKIIRYTNDPFVKLYEQSYFLSLTLIKHNSFCEMISEWNLESRLLTLK